MTKSCRLGCWVCAVVTCVWMWATTASAEIITSNQITGQNPGAFNPYTTGVVTGIGVDASGPIGIGRGSGLNGENAANEYRAWGWSTGGLNSNDYFSFFITPESGYSINFDSFTYTGIINGGGPTQFALRSSLDGFTTNIGSIGSTGTVNFGAGFQNVSAPIEFRLYGWNARHDNPSSHYAIADYRFDGSFSAVPEPSALLLIGVASSAGLLHRRRRGSRPKA